jgi:hypothetical protein
VANETELRLISDWLDAPDEPRLRARVESACATSESFAAEVARWRRLHALLAETTEMRAAVDWARTRSLCDDGMRAADAIWEQSLRSATNIEPRLDWRRLHARVCAAALPAPRGARRTRAARGALALIAGAAAAAIWLAVPTAPGPTRGPGARDARVWLATTVKRTTARTAPRASVLVVDAGAPTAPGAAPSDVELFIMIQPTPVRHEGGPAALFGLQ